MPLPAALQPPLLRLLPAVLALAAPAAPLGARAQDACPAGMVLVEGGTLAEPGRPRARIRTYCLDRTEVTADAFAACAAIGACKVKTDELECGNAATFGKKGLGGHPVNCVTWGEAEGYCSELGKRLPSEPEWEWAARGGERALPFPWGDAPPESRACWDGDGSAKGKGERKGTCPTAGHPRGASADGAMDLAGNVREWTSTAQDRHRIVRGGSWGDSIAEFLGTGFRGWNAPDERIELTGFRCAAALGANVHGPVRPPPPPPKAAATTDEAGVLVFDEPLELGSKRRP